MLYEKGTTLETQPDAGNLVKDSICRLFILSYSCLSLSSKFCLVSSRFLVVFNASNRNQNSIHMPFSLNFSMINMDGFCVIYV